MRVILSTWFEGGNPGDVIDVDDIKGRVMIADGQGRPAPDEVADDVPVESPVAAPSTPTDATGITPFGSTPSAK